MGLGIRSRLRKRAARYLWDETALPLLIQSDGEALVKSAQASGQTKKLTDKCIEILKAVGTLPEPEHALHRYLKTPEEERRPMTSFGNYMLDCREAVKDYRKGYEGGGDPIFLDVGGNKGEMKSVAEGYAYWLVDLTVRTDDADRCIQADICEPLPVDPGTVDVIFSNQVWEHLERPWLACQELGKLLKPGGLFITATLFAYRYHPLPEDFFRYSHKGLASIHEEFAGTETVLCNYDIRIRRNDIRGGGHTLGVDIPPADWLGGWRENWYVYYIGRKR